MKRPAHLPTILFLVFVLLAGGSGLSTAAALDSTTQEVLLPYFEVDLREPLPPSWATLFSIGNTSYEDVEVTIEVWSNWGILIPELMTTFTQPPRA